MKGKYKDQLKETDREKKRKRKRDPQMSQKKEKVKAECSAKVLLGYPSFQIEN